MLIFCLIFGKCLALQAQENLYDFIKTGNFEVGFRDTLIFDYDNEYQAYGYDGPKPYFIQIWHPITVKNNSSKPLTFHDFFRSKTDTNLSVIRNQLVKHYQEAVVRDYIEENLETGQANDFGSYSYQDISGLMGNIETKSLYMPRIESNQLPVIIYHHGSQSFSFENYMMAEYFASRGFIFVSANYHLPYENTLFGLKPFEQIVKEEEEQDLRTILQFSESLSGSKSVFFIGHSWGAQMGFRTLDKDTRIKGFVSLETTIEYKTDWKKIEEMWPEVYQKVLVEHAEYPFPVLLCAATGKEEPFPFFETLRAPQLVYASTKETFEHNAYLSAFYLRLCLDGSIRQRDTETLRDRLVLYVKHLELINEFIDGICKGKKTKERTVKLIGNE